MGLGWLKAAFTAPDTISSIVKGAKDGLDSLVYTAEEKAHDNAKLLAQQAAIRLKAQEQVVEFMKATAPQAATRRWLAKLIAVLWALVFVTPVVLQVSAVWMTDYRTELRESARLIDDMVAGIDTFMLAVVAFYLGSPHLRGAMETLTAYKRGRRKIGDADIGDAS